MNDTRDAEAAGNFPSPAHQTVTYLQSLLEANGLRPRRQFGQNFLVDLNLLDLLVRASRVGKKDVVLEVGAGTGGLTTRLADVAGQVLSVELDKGFFRLAQSQTRDYPNVRLLEGDILKGKNRIHPAVVSALRETMANQGVDHFHLVANLPYDVSTAVIGNLLLLEDPEVRSLTVTLQAEFAERMVADPGSKNYGPLSVLVQLVGRSKWIRGLPPSVFWPRPKVRSAIVHIEVSAARKQQLHDLDRMYRFIRDLFMHRRKLLRGGILAVPGCKVLRADIDVILAQVGLPPDVRAEQLAPKQLQSLYEALRSVAGTIGGPEEDGVAKEGSADAGVD